MDLTAIPWRTTRYPGIAIHFSASDKATGRVRAMIRMDPGCGYPEHRHRAEEHVLVVQGGYRDARGEHRAGDFVRYDARSCHAPVATGDAGDPACVLLALAHEGITLLGG